MNLSTEQILKIGRDFQYEDRWHGSQYETAKLLCDTIERLVNEHEEFRKNTEALHVTECLAVRKEVEDECKKPRRNCDRFNSGNELQDTHNALLAFCEEVLHTDNTTQGLMSSGRMNIWLLTKIRKNEDE